jgi:hypothetical protein
MPRARNGQQNGHTAIRRMPVRTLKVELEGDYADFSLTMRANPPLRTFTDMQSNADFSVLRDTVRSLIVDWDIVDDEGQPIPMGDLEALPIDLFGMIISRYLETITSVAAVPKA